MSDLRRLCEELSLPQPDIERLERVEAQLPLIAEVTNADVFIDVPVDDERALVVHRHVDEHVRVRHLGDQRQLRLHALQPLDVRLRERQLLAQASQIAHRKPRLPFPSPERYCSMSACASTAIDVRLCMDSRRST